MNARLDLLRSAPARDHHRPVKGELSLLGRFFCPWVMLKSAFFVPVDAYVVDEGNWDPDLTFNDKYFVVRRYGTSIYKLFLSHQQHWAEYPSLFCVPWDHFYMSFGHLLAPDESGSLPRWWDAHPAQRQYREIRFFPIIKK